MRKALKFSKYLAKYGINLLRYPFMSDSAVFADIHSKRIWEHSGTRSGDGSTLEATETLRRRLPEIIDKYEITSILDIPCGDFGWMRHVDIRGASYIGADIVPEIVETNTAHFADPGVRDFRILDICSDPLPQVDMIFCRDCLVHLSNRRVSAALANIAASGAKYLMATTFTDRKRNFDIPTGAWRPINLEKPPFDLPSPVETINEECRQRAGRFPDKTMGLWQL